MKWLYLLIVPHSFEFFSLPHTNDYGSKLMQLIDINFRKILNFIILGKRLRTTEIVV